jgi:hypothetical protein
MSVPGTFTQLEIEKGRQFLIKHLSNCVIIKGVIKRQPLVTYTDLMQHMGWDIEDEFDGLRAGDFAGAISHLELDLGGPMLSAIVVHKEANGYPGKPGNGFYKYATDLGRLGQRENIDPDGGPESTLWSNEVLACVKKYGK